MAVTWDVVELCIATVPLQLMRGPDNGLHNWDQISVQRKGRTIFQDVLTGPIVIEDLYSDVSNLPPLCGLQHDENAFADGQHLAVDDIGHLRNFPCPDEILSSSGAKGPIRDGIAALVRVRIVGFSCGVSKEDPLTSFPIPTFVVLNICESDRIMSLAPINRSAEPAPFASLGRRGESRCRGGG